MVQKIAFLECWSADKNHHDFAVVWCEFQQVYIHYYPIQDSIVKIDSFHGSIDDFEGTFAEGIEYINNLYAIVHRLTQTESEKLGY
jgi:hypothetical protein